MNKSSYWTSHIKAQEKSGKTRKSYCESECLNFHTFTYWKQKLMGSKKPSEKKFAPVKVTESPKAQYELELPSGHLIKFSSGFVASEIKSIMELTK